MKEIILHDVENVTFKDLKKLKF